jgi:ribosome recycling factor
MVKQAARVGEEHKVAIRNVRREANDTLKKMEKDGGMTKDELARYEGDVQKMTDRYIVEIDKSRVAKEAEIMEV